MDEIRMAIRGEIDRQGMKDAYVAGQSGMSVQAFSAMMNGRRKLYADELVRIADVLRVDIKDLTSQAGR